MPSFLLVGSAANDPPVTTYRINASEVRVTFFVTDENNLSVTTIGKDDFAVIDNGLVIREFRSLMRADETAIDVLIAIDASESVAPRFQATMNDVMTLISSRRAAGDEKISVVAFGGLQPVLICDQECGSAAAQEKLRNLRPIGATPLFDVMAMSANLMASRRVAGVRPVIILFSDGNDTISKTGAQEALQDVIASGGLLYAIDLQQAGTASYGAIFLRQMSEATGGRYFLAREGATKILQAALEDLHASYVVTYKLPNHARGFHSLRLLPKHNLNLQFHCRNGYFYESNAQ